MTGRVHQFAGPATPVPFSAATRAHADGMRLGYRQGVRWGYVVGFAWGVVVSGLAAAVCLWVMR